MDGGQSKRRAGRGSKEGQRWVIVIAIEVVTTNLCLHLLHSARFAWSSC